MLFKKILSIFTAIALLFLAGCQKEEIKEFPEHVKGTFDFENVINNTILDGKPLFTGMKFSDLSKKLTLGDCFLDYEKQHPENNRHTKVYNFLYDDEDVGSIELENDSNEVFNIRIEDEFPNEKLSVCGINLKFTHDDVVKTFGEPINKEDTYEDVDVLKYGVIKKENIYFLFFGSETVKTVNIYIIGGETNE
ncbi:MAG: hypothetical protein LBL93_06290 [Ruminococcus sp.]|nr:hypothetical protein [Ruminococcus sp.]